MSNPNPANEVSQKRPGAMAAVALICSIIGLVLCWFPIIGITHAIAGTVLGAMARKEKPDRYSIAAIAAGAAAVIAAVVLLIIELNSIPLVNTYDAAPWV